MGGQERGNILGKVGVDRQGYDVARVDLIGLGVHPEIYQGMTLGSLGIAEFEDEVHTRQSNLLHRLWLHYRRCRVHRPNTPFQSRAFPFPEKSLFGPARKLPTDPSPQHHHPHRAMNPDPIYAPFPSQLESRPPPPPRHRSPQRGSRPPPTHRHPRRQREFRPPPTHRHPRRSGGPEP